VLSEVTADGGIGVCHPGVPAATPVGLHVHLAIALGSNVLIGLQTRVLRPGELVDELTFERASRFAGGTCDALGRVCGDRRAPVPAAGKCDPLFARFEDD
jgi:hypothetical protein